MFIPLRYTCDLYKDLDMKFRIENGFQKVPHWARGCDEQFFKGRKGF